MADFSDFINQNQNGFQGLAALGQALSQAGAPSRIPLSVTQRLGATLPQFNQQMKNLQDHQLIQQAMQTTNPADMFASLGKVQDPELQKAILTNRLTSMATNPIFALSSIPDNNAPSGGAPTAPPTNTATSPGADAPATPAWQGMIPGSQTPPLAAPPAPPAQAAPAQASPQSGLDLNYMAQAKRVAPVAAQMAEDMIGGTFKQESGKGANDPNYVAALAIAKRVDPTFGAQSLIGRPQMVENSTKGKLYTDATNLNAVAGHLYDLHQAAPGLNNGASPLVNWAENTVANNTGYGSQPKISNYDSILVRAAPELNKYYVGGEGDAQGREDAKKPFASDLPTNVIQTNVKTQLGLLGSKAATNQQQYDSTMGAASNWKVMNPTSQALIADINGKQLTPDQQKLVNAHRAESNLPPKTWGNQIQPGTKDYNNAILQAKSAITKGANRAAVLQRLQASGINPTGI